MARPDTETLDRLYLEWSQFTEARTARELEMAKRLAIALDALTAAASALHLGALASNGKTFDDLMTAREAAADAMLAIRRPPPTTQANGGK